ncbi:alpha/beta fold hydrolase [Plebeiibacterium sediminum]|uniref:Alpha/beta hydrolase n=1 Tax=Plebeiibacterium sediminum TaxID=2992112 RepID=A0AAE3SEX9_9BACT|nr:alpha/beta hydrolase [Plebeiobacterium sediminum]MCW3786437.1 alpha/beta hydrolase [Plebeiobacterium sediminum]
MKNSILLLCVIFSLFQTYAQNNDEVNYGSNLENGRHISVNNSTIYYETYGQGTPLLLIHGGLGSIMNYENSIKDLSKHFKVIAMDSPGHGRSSHLDSLSYQILAENVSHFIDKLGLDSLYVIGWSDGGIIGLLLAAERPDKIKKLVAISANTRLSAIKQQDIEWMKNGMIAWAKNENGWWMKNQFPLRSQPEKVDEYLDNTKKMWLVDINIDDAMIESIKIPTLIMQGDKDVIKTEHALELNRAIVNSQLCILPNTSHFVFGSKPDLVNRIIIDFLNGK